MVTIVHVIARMRDDSAVLFYKDGILIEEICPPPEYANMERLTEKLSGQKPESFEVKQTSNSYPKNLEEIKNWPRY